jgi:hypothetical protein
VTDATRQRDAAVFGELADATEGALGRYSEHELELLRGFLDTVRRIVTAHIERLTGSPG